MTAVRVLQLLGCKLDGRSRRKRSRPGDLAAL